MKTKKVSLQELKNIIIDIAKQELGNLSENKRNVKTVKIIVPDQAALRLAKTTPVFKQLTRLDLKVGENIENVNHKQFYDMQRMYPMIRIEVEEVDNSSKLSEMAKSLAEATRVTPFSFDDEFNKDEDIFDNRGKLIRVITKHLKKKPFTNNADWGGGYVWNIIGNDNYTGTFLYLGDNELTILKRTEVGEEYQDKQIKSISNSKELYKFLKDKKI
jgi:hypothetical protein